MNKLKKKIKLTLFFKKIPYIYKEKINKKKKESNILILLICINILFFVIYKYLII